MFFAVASAVASLGVAGANEQHQISQAVAAEQAWRNMAAQQASAEQVEIFEARRAAEGTVIDGTCEDATGVKLLSND